MHSEMKRFKDPIYGYIDIEIDIVENIIDTANFQRLRDVVQTSYAPLYASAVHNRFVHSIGVYHLGKIVAKSFLESLRSSELENVETIERLAKIFEYACLLHDVGHAPFSHTGEGYYLSKDPSREQHHNEIQCIIKDENILKEIADKNYKAAAHELMSCLVGLQEYAELFKSDEERGFFVRCITGYQYVEDLDEKKSICNCMISLLNSSIIDVDKLDYLIRDAYITGFNTISIDYERLLTSVQIRKTDNQWYEIVYHKNAISIIENVIYAHDAERKWIQNHPVVQYDAFLLRHAIESVNQKYDIQLFSQDSLTVKGKTLDGNLKVSLLSDSDIVFLMKNIEDDKLITEYFSRKDRRHPLWKSEAEYKAIFNKGYSDRGFVVIENAIDQIIKYLNSLNQLSINQTAIEACKKDIEETEKLNIEMPALGIPIVIESKKRYLKWLECFKAFADSQGILFDFVIVKANQFNSGFGKVEVKDIKIIFPDREEICKFEDVTNILLANKSEREKFFYLFYYREDKKIIDVSFLARELGKLALDEIYSN